MRNKIKEMEGYIVERTQIQVGEIEIPLDEDQQSKPKNEEAHSPA